MILCYHIPIRIYVSASFDGQTVLQSVTKGKEVYCG